MKETTNNRVVAIINFLAANPTESFTISEIGEKLQISAGSAHRVLKVLTDARYLARHPKHKTYSLGLALAAVGQATLERHPYVDVAHREMELLSSELDVQCVAVSVVEDEILTLARTGRPQSSGGITRVGERRPFVPPFGIAHMAWAPAGKIEGYLSRSIWPQDDQRQRYMRDALKVIRKRGFSMASAGPALRQMHLATQAYFEGHDKEDLWNRTVRLMGEISGDELQVIDLENRSSGVQVSHISAPVFDARGDVVLEVVLTGGWEVVSCDAIKRYAQRLCTVAAFITAETHGRAPVESP